MKMKAIVYEKYGGPEVLSLSEEERPQPQENEVLVRVKASALNPGDRHRIRGILPIRLSEGWSKPKYSILGGDFSGIVEAVGAKNQNYKVGEEVYGEAPAGAFGEYLCVAEERLAIKPKNLSFAEAAAVPIAALTAYKSIYRDANLKAGQKVLINGASGGVGTFMVQMAKACGAEVTGVCSTRNLELVKGLGADQVIDYTQTPLSAQKGDYDFVIDTVGNLNFSDHRRLLAQGGKGIVVGMESFGKLLKVMLFGNAWYWRKGPKINPMMPNEKFQDLLQIKELIESGKVHPVIDRTYALDLLPEGMQYLELGHSRGKNVIQIA